MEQVRARNSSTALGPVWCVLNPLLLAGIYFLLFGVIFRAQQTVDDYSPLPAAAPAVRLAVVYVLDQVPSTRRAVVEVVRVYKVNSRKAS